MCLQLIWSNKRPKIQIQPSSSFVNPGDFLIQSWSYYSTVSAHLLSPYTELTLLHLIWDAELKLSCFYSQKKYLTILTTTLSQNCKICFTFFIEVKLIYNTVLVSDIQQGDSIMHTYIAVLCQIIFLYRLLQNIDYFLVLYNSVQFSSVAQSYPTLCNPMNRSTPGLPVHHQLQEFTQTHVHWVGDASQPSHPLSSPSLPALNLSQHQGLFQ